MRVVDWYATGFMAYRLGVSLAGAPKMRKGAKPNSPDALHNVNAAKWLQGFSAAKAANAPKFSDLTAKLAKTRRLSAKVSRQYSLKLQSQTKPLMPSSLLEEAA